MKQLWLIILLLYFSGIGAHAQTRFGVKAGATASKYNADEINITNGSGVDVGVADYKFGYGFRIGGVMEYALNRSFTVQPGLLFSLLQASIGAENLDENVRHQSFYLQLPVNAKYKYNFANGDNLHFLAGPYIGYGLFGRVYADGEDQDYDIFDKGYDERFDAGLNFGLGYEIAKKYSLNAGFQLGLKEMNLLNAKWRSFELSLTYFI